MNNKTILTDDQIESLAGINDHNSFSLRAHNDMKLARAIEQAVLQSPEVQALRKDAERILFIADDGCEFVTWIQDDYTTKYRLKWNRGPKWQPEWFDTPEDAIDAAMEKQT